MFGSSGLDRSSDQPLWRSASQCWVFRGHPFLVETGPLHARPTPALDCSGLEHVTVFPLVCLFACVCVGSAITHRCSHALGACLLLRLISPGSWSPLDVQALANSDAALALIRFGARPLLVFSTLRDQPIWRSVLAPYDDRASPRSLRSRPLGSAYSARSTRLGPLGSAHSAWPTRLSSLGALPLRRSALGCQLLRCSAPVPRRSRLAGS